MDNATEKPKYAYYAMVRPVDRPMPLLNVIYESNRAWTDPNGVFRPESCKGLTPSADGIYVIDNGHPQARLMKAAMERAKENGNAILGPFDNRMDAVMAERNARPLSDAEKLAQFEQQKQELAELRKKVEATNNTAGNVRRAG